MKFPKTSIPASEVISLLEKKIKTGRSFLPEKTFSGYFPTPDVEDILKEANKMFFWANALSPMSFPSLKKFEAEVVAFMIDLMNGDENVVGNMTTGSDENILMAVKVARDYFREIKPEIEKAEIIIPQTASPAYLKAAHYFNLRVQTLAVDENYLANVNELQKLINKNTILIVGSAPSYALGIIDPIEKMAEMADKNNILFHVDANPYPTLPTRLASEPKREVEGVKQSFDYRIKGVTSISFDLYYSMGPKGAGVILYRDKDLRKHQYFTYTQYPGGLYGSPSLTGSRAGGPIAASWALINYWGKIPAPLPASPQRGEEVKVLGKPVLNIFAFRCPNYKEVHAELLNKGWFLEKLDHFEALRIHLSPIHKNSIEVFINELKQIINERK
jgi:glutamate/tyrosine decarboxylase-like PLP-dependent enzyme